MYTENQNQGRECSSRQGVLKECSRQVFTSVIAVLFFSVKGGESRDWSGRKEKGQDVRITGN